MDLEDLNREGMNEMSWNEYLAYLSARWLRRFAASDGSSTDKAAEKDVRDVKEPWTQWWFGVLPLGLKLMFHRRFRRFSR